MTKNKLYGAILGDLAGQPYEFKYKGDFSEFKLHDERSHITDDSIMTLATAWALLNETSFECAYKVLGAKYDSESFGKKFRQWIKEPSGTIYDSFGNGCLMRMSPIMYMNDNIKRQKELIIESCLSSHSHPKSILSCLYLHDLYQNAETRKDILVTSAEIKPFNEFKVEAEDTIDFVRSAYIMTYHKIQHPSSTQEHIKRVVKCGGDTDTNASIIGELMNYTFNDLTKEDVDYVESKLDSYLLDILHGFNKEF